MAWRWRSLCRSLGAVLCVIWEWGPRLSCMQLSSVAAVRGAANGWLGLASALASLCVSPVLPIGKGRHGARPPAALNQPTTRRPRTKAAWRPQRRFEPSPAPTLAIRPLAPLPRTRRTCRRAKTGLGSDPRALRQRARAARAGSKRRVRSTNGSALKGWVPVAGAASDGSGVLRHRPRHCDAARGLGHLGRARAGPARPRRAVSP